jgi:murein DD-endopeptidase MepM/ murein hydrolase activator NlpD
MHLKQNKKTHKTKLTAPVVGLAVVIALAFGAYRYFEDRSLPEISIAPETSWVGGATPLEISVADSGLGLKELMVQLIQGNKTIDRLHQVFSPPVSAYSTAIEPPDKDLKDGPFTLRVTARDASWARIGKGNLAEAARSFQLDTVAPRIDLFGGTHNLNQGGAGAAAYTLSEEVKTTGVRVGSFFFPGYAQPNGNFVCIFSQPNDMRPDQFQPEVVAIDNAGNERTQALPHHSNARAFRHDTINISDSFLKAKMRQFSDRYPGKSELEVFLAVNRDLRKENRERLQDIGKSTSPTPFWSGAFERMPGKTMATFGDRREYRHNGQVVDHQTHLGVDIARIRHAPVGAANAGRIAFTGFYGIYGNSVIIDHGLGLMTLYAHLSAINVTEGQSVEKGQIIGRTGATGMAGGDHLHFGVLVSGVPVNPVEWWDAAWIKNNIDPSFVQ